MISLNYVKNGVQRDDIFTPFLAYIESVTTDVSDLNDTKTKRLMLEYEITGNMTDEVKAYFEAEDKDFFTRLGDKIKELFAKFAEMVNKIIDKVRDLTFESKGYSQKMEILLKKHPDLKDEVIMACSKGALDLGDMKSIKEMDAAFDEVLKMAKKDNVDPKTLKGKMQKAVQKFKEDDEKKWMAVKVAGAVTVGVGAYLAVRTLKSKVAESDDKYRKARESANDYNDEVVHFLNSNECTNREVAEELLLGNKDRLAAMTRSFNNQQGFINRLNSAVSTFLGHYDNAERLRDANARDEYRRFKERRSNEREGETTRVTETIKNAVRDN